MALIIKLLGQHKKVIMNLFNLPCEGSWPHFGDFRSFETQSEHHMDPPHLSVQALIVNLLLVPVSPLSYSKSMIRSSPWLAAFGGFEDLAISGVIVVISRLPAETLTCSCAFWRRLVRPGCQGHIRSGSVWPPGTPHSLSLSQSQILCTSGSGSRGSPWRFARRQMAQTTATERSPRSQVPSCRQRCTSQNHSGCCQWLGCCWQWSNHRLGVKTCKTQRTDFLRGCC